MISAGEEDRLRLIHSEVLSVPAGRRNMTEGKPGVSGAALCGKGSRILSSPDQAVWLAEGREIGDGRDTSRRC